MTTLLHYCFNTRTIKKEHLNLPLYQTLAKTSKQSTENPETDYSICPYAETAAKLKYVMLATPISYQLKGIAIRLPTINQKSFGVLKLSKTRKKMKSISWKCCILDQFYAAAELFHMSNNHAPLSYCSNTRAIKTRTFESPIIPNQGSSIIEGITTKSTLLKEGA